MELIAVIALILLIMIPVAFFTALGNKSSLRTLRDEILTIQARLTRIERDTSALAKQFQAGHVHEAAKTVEGASGIGAQAAPPMPPEKATKAAPPRPDTAADLDTPSHEAEPQKATTAATVSHVPSAVRSAPVRATHAKSARHASFDDMEKNLSTKWMMWVGGIALALGGGFLVKYSIDAGLLSPAVRVTLAVLFGLALTIGGEVVHRRHVKPSWLEDAPDYMPSALSAAGLFTLYAALFAAYSLYDMLSPLVAFGALALVSLGASALALMQGRFFGYLGLVGGMLVPALVSTGDANAWALFPYLLFVVGTTLAVSRRQAWADVATSTLALACLWVILWIGTSWHSADVIPVGLYLLILGGLNGWLLQGASPERSANPTIAGIFPSHPISAVSDGVSFLVFILLASLVRLDHYGTASMLWFTFAFAAQAYAVFRDGEHDLTGLGALGASLFLLGTWHIPNLIEVSKAAANPALHIALGPIAPPGFATFVTACVLFAGSVGLAAFALLPHLLRKSLWASVSVGYPILVLLIAYGRLNNFDTSIPFAAIAVGMAGLFTLGATSLNRQDPAIWRVPFGGFLAGATLTLALALAIALRDAWLSFALALEIAALGYIWRTLRIDGLRVLAHGLAVTVLVRLLFNPAVLGYAPDGPGGVINWFFYGYGLTAALFAVAARLFWERSPTDSLGSTLKAGAAMLLIAFTTLEIRVLASDDGTLFGGYSALEAALQTLNWSAAATVLFWREVKDGNILFGYLRRFMTIVSLLGFVIGNGLAHNILLSRVDVGLLPVANLQILQFFVPALIYALKAQIAHGAGRARSSLYYGAVALAGLFLWLTVEVRHLFHPHGGSGTAGDWEWYGYSFAWLLYAVSLLAAGIRLEMRELRRAGLGVLGIVVLKVFLLDMGNLEGIARALSFMGLGGALIGLGYLYQYLSRQDAEEAPRQEQ